MGQSVEVVTSELHLAADRLRGAGQRLQDGLSSVDLETSNLLGSGWQGEAATAFEKYWDQWHSGAGQVVRALQTMSDALDVAARNYAATDESAGGALDGTMQGGGGGAATGGGTSGGAGAVGSGASAGSGGEAAAPSGSSSASGAGQKPDLAQQMNLGEVMQPISQAAGMPAQVAGQLAGGLTQAGQVVAGAAQQAVQMATELAQQAETGAEAAAGEEPTEKAPVGRSAEPDAEPAAEREL